MGIRSQLLIFIKNPILGKVKTRLADSIGDEKALEVYNDLLQYTKNITEGLDVDKKVFYSDFIDNEDIWKNDFFDKDLQLTEGDLGDKMSDAFFQSFYDEYNNVVIIGSDCMEITQEIILQAFEKLNAFDVVIGPANDGGYYLLGMKMLHPNLFKNKKWSTSNVFELTMKDIRQNNLTYYKLPVLSDVDTIDDLESILKRI